jgi:hypothetical protein
MAKLNFALQFDRLYSGPLDIDAVFTTTSALNAYLTNGKRYAGQMATCLEQPGKIFVLNNAKDAWTEIAPQEQLELGDLSGITITNPASGQVLTYNGISWVNSDPAVKSVNGFTGIITLDTDDIAEGASNKYYPSADASKLAGIEAGAQVNTVNSVNGETGAVVLDAGDISYDNTDTTLLATAVQGAIDELYLKKADVSALSSNLILYPTTAQADVTGYSKMVTDVAHPDYNSVAVNIPTGTITATNQLLASLISEPGLIVGSPGIINILTLGNIRKVAGNSNTYAEFFYRVFKRDSLGLEQLLAVSDTTGAINPDILNNYLQFNADALLNNGTFLSTDRIVIKYYGNNLAGGASAYEFQFGGTNPVRTLLPVPASVTVVNQTASTVPVDTSSFSGVLSNADDTVQKALETIDALEIDVEETDPVFTASPAGGITSQKITNWDDAYSWGNHASSGYLTSASTLDATKLSGTIPNASLPPLALTDVHVVTTEAEMIALTAQEGDVAIRTDVKKSFIHNGSTSGTIGDWNELLTPTDAVLSVNGQVGVVSIDASDIGALSSSDSRIANWDTAHSWGDHSVEGYATEQYVQTAIEGLGTGDVESVNGKTGVVVLTNADIELEQVVLSESRTIGLSDLGKMLVAINESQIEILIPNNSTTAIPVNSEVLITQYNEGPIVFNEDTSVEIKVEGDAPLVLNKKYSSALLKKISTDEWLLVLPAVDTVATTPGASALTELTDVTIENIQQKQILAYDGTEWKNTNVIDTLVSEPGENVVLEGLFEIGEGTIEVGQWTLNEDTQLYEFLAVETVEEYVNLYGFNPSEEIDTVFLNSAPASFYITESYGIVITVETLPTQASEYYVAASDVRLVEQLPGEALVVTSINSQRGDVVLKSLPETANNRDLLYFNVDSNQWEAIAASGTAGQTSDPQGFNLFPNSNYIDDMIEDPENPGLGLLTIAYDSENVPENTWQTWQAGLEAGFVPSPANLYIETTSSGGDFFGTSLVSFDANNIVLRIQSDAYSTIVAAGQDLTAVWMNFIYTSEATGLGLATQEYVNEQINNIQINSSQIGDKENLLVQTQEASYGYSVAAIDWIYDENALMYKSSVTGVSLMSGVELTVTVNTDGDPFTIDTYGFDSNTLELTFFTSVQPTSDSTITVEFEYQESLAVISINGQKGELTGFLTESSEINASNITTGTIPESVLPRITITSTKVVADIEARDALEDVEEGDIAIVTSESKSYILDEFSAWQELKSPTGAVQSVNGETGAVTLTAASVGAYSQAQTDTLLEGKVDVSTFNTHTHTISDIIDYQPGGGGEITYVRATREGQSNITMTTANVYYVILSIELTAGTWQISSSCRFDSISANNYVFLQLFNFTTSTSIVESLEVGTNYETTMHANSIIVVPDTTVIQLTAKSQATSRVVLGNANTQINAIKLA